ncbi:cystatin-like [Python bivittatus]|uniref:Cystatin-like n=1 Tax=Python bivittatus TaxID=176946 RepID=A0A9F2RBK7_PYTBI|nr:cystatin-like [Python bivittatus]
MACSPLPRPAPLFLLGALLTLPLVLLEEVGIPGGLSPASPTDDGVQKAAAFAVEQYNTRSTDNTNYFKVLRIVQAQSQVVAGVKYYLTVEVVKTACEKSNGPMAFNKIQNCELPPRAEQEKLTCYFEVWSQPWLNKMELLKMSCS